MNEIEFEIGGKVRRFKLGLGFLGELLSHFDTNMMGLGRIMVNNPFSTTPAILYLSHKSYCMLNAVPVDFTLQQVEVWIEELEDWQNDKNIEALLGVLFESIQKYIPQQKGEGAKDEKKN